LNFFLVHTLPRQNNQINQTNNNGSLSTQDMLHVNGPSSSSTAALINAFIDSDDEPLYDKVASDEDYSNLPNNEQQKRSKLNKKSKKNLSTFDSSKEHNVDGLLQSPSEVNYCFDLYNLFFVFVLEFKFIGNIK
jgi:hypothetical protein